MKQQHVAYSIQHAGPIAVLVALLCATSVAQPGGQPDLLPYPDFTDTSLTNGLRMLIAENHEQPAVFCQILIPVGTRDEPAGKEGIAEVVASALTQGTKARTADQIAARIDGIGGQLSASADEEFTLVSCQVLAEDADTGLALFSDVILNPVFPQRDIERVKRQSIAELQQEMKEPFSRTMAAMRRTMFGAGNRMGREKTEKTLNGIKAADVAQFYRNNYFPNKAILVAIGDFSTADMLARIDRRFASWPPGVPLNPRLPYKPEPFTGRKLRLVNLPGQTQGNILVSEWSIESHNPDRPALEIVNYVFGGGSFSSRLFQAIREEQGKTYGVSSRNVYHPDFGTWGMGTFTRTNEVVNTCSSLVTEVRKLADAGITPEELAKAKSFFRGNLPLRLEAPTGVARRVLEGLFQGYTLTELREEGIRMESVTLEDANRIARRYFSQDNFAMVIVGEAKQLRKPLAAFGKFDEER